MPMRPAPLPIDAIVPDVVAALRTHSAVVLHAPTGAGKTTRVPPALLEAGLAGAGEVVVLEPRRLAARAAARRMASERGERIGDSVGFHVRFDRQAGPDTRVLVVTPGILLRRLLDDPFLEAARVLVFDEFHERGLDSDLALGIARLLQQTVRPDLRLVVMSATLSADRIAAYLGGCPVVVSMGRMFPVSIEYQARSTRDSWPDAAAKATATLLDRTDGDLLVFLPGMQEIRRTTQALAPRAHADGLLLLPLHGDLPIAEQDRALVQQDRRRIVLATNVAETSVTVEGISGVVDTGIARTMSFDPDLGLDRLEVTAIARDAADQRAGRAGRLRPGVCVRLWSEAAHRLRPAESVPEIRRVDLARAVLQLFCLGETDVRHFPWFEPPDAEAVDHALGLLRLLGLIEDGNVTALGHRIAELPLHPRLGRMLLAGSQWGHPARLALGAALLSERDPFRRESAGRPVSAQHHPTSSDVLDRVEALEDFERTNRTATSLGILHLPDARATLHVRDQLLRHLSGTRADRRAGASPPMSADEALLRGLLAAFPDRVARRREGDRTRGVMVGGRGVQLAPWSRVLESPLFLCIDVDSRSAEAWVGQASAIQREWLPASVVNLSTEVFFDPAAERVAARRRVRYADLILEEGTAALPGREEATPILTSAARAHLDRVLPPEDSPGGSFLLRTRCLRAWMPQLDLPAFADEDLAGMLPWLSATCRSFEELRQADWLGALQGGLTVQQRLAVEREAPERLKVPSGNKPVLKYALDRAPVLAVRIQELFGLHDTPRIAGGRVRVLLHLLGPNYRPQQITDDLASFWTNTYPQVRKDLRARYPRHAWPEDPRSALPEKRPRRRAT